MISLSVSLQTAARLAANPSFSIRARDFCTGEFRPVTQAEVLTSPAFRTGGFVTLVDNAIDTQTNEPADAIVTCGRRGLLVEVELTMKGGAR